jgi:hypothetical protein
LKDQIKNLDAKVLEAESKELVLQTITSNLEDQLLESQTKEIELLKRISKIRDEMQNKSILFVSKEKRFLKIINQQQNYASSLELKIDNQATLVSKLKSNVSKSFDIVLNEKAKQSCGTSISKDGQQKVFKEPFLTNKKLLFHRRFHRINLQNLLRKRFLSLPITPCKRVRSILRNLLLMEQQLLLLSCPSRIILCLFQEQNLS